MFHLFCVNAVSLVSLAAKASCCCGVFGCVAFFLCVVLLGLVWFPCSAFASLHAFVPSLTGAQRTDSSPASKKEFEAADTWNETEYTVKRSVALLTSVTAWPNFNMNKPLQTQLLRLEEVYNDTRKAGAPLADNSKLQFCLDACLDHSKRT